MGLARRWRQDDGPIEDEPFPVTRTLDSRIWSLGQRPDEQDFDDAGEFDRAYDTWQATMEALFDDPSLRSMRATSNLETLKSPTRLMRSATRKMAGLRLDWSLRSGRVV
jgi:hypothetical protein